MSFEIVIRFLLGVCNKQTANMKGQLPIDLADDSGIKKLLE
jgi:hypothetical protein